MKTYNFYHGSIASGLSQTEDSNFSGVFASWSYDDACEIGDYVYRIEIVSGMLLTKNMIHHYFNDEFQGTKRRYEALNIIKNEAKEYINKLINEFGLEYRNAVDKLFNYIFFEEKFEELDELGVESYICWTWELQKIRGEFAFKNGYDAVEAFAAEEPLVLIKKGIKMSEIPLI